MEGPEPARWTESPSGELILIVGLGDEHFLPPDSAGSELQAFSCSVVGFHDRPIVCRHDGGQFGVQVRLDPLGAYSLTGVPAHELADHVVALSDLIGPAAEQWAERLLSTGSWAERLALADVLVTERIAAGPVPSPEIARAWRLMRRAHGAIRIADLADAVGCGQGRLVAGFRAQIGTTPKRAAQVLRYGRAARSLARGEWSVARVAAACGYADQAHLTREFTRFAGLTPAAVRRAAR